MRKIWPGEGVKVGIAGNPSEPRRQRNFSRSRYSFARWTDGHAAASPLPPRLRAAQHQLTPERRSDRPPGLHRCASTARPCRIRNVIPRRPHRAVRRRQSVSGALTPSRAEFAGLAFGRQPSPQITAPKTVEVVRVHQTPHDSRSRPVQCQLRLRRAAAREGLRHRTARSSARWRDEASIRCNAVGTFRRSSSSAGRNVWYPEREDPIVGRGGPKPTRARSIATRVAGCRPVPSRSNTTRGATGRVMVEPQNLRRGRRPNLRQRGRLEQRRSETRWSTIL